MQEVSKVSTAKGLVASRTLELTGPAEAVADQLEKAVSMARAEAGQQSKLFGALTLVCVLGTIAAAVTHIGVLAVVLGILAFLSVIKLAKSAVISFDKNRQSCAQEILAVVKRDSREDSEVKLTMRFLKPVDKSNLLQTGVTRKTYSDHWLSVRGRFADGTKYLVTVKEITQVKNRKLKVKPKGFVVSLILVFADKKYPGVGRFAGRARESLQLTKRSELKSIKVSDGVFRLSVKLPELALHIPHRTGGPGLIADTVMMMLLSAYQILNLTSSLSKPPA